MNARRASRSPLLGLSAALLVAVLAGCADSVPEPPHLDVTPAQEAEQATIDLQRYADAVLVRYPDAVLPAVDRVRYITTSEWGQTIADCLNEEGFDATTSPDGGLGTEQIDAQDEPYLIAMYVCNAKYPLDPRQTLPLVDDQIRYLYDYYVKVATPCLEGMGFEVTDPPSQPTYIDSYRVGPSWRPYEDAALRSSPEQWQQILTECPEAPPGVYGR